MDPIRLLEQPGSQAGASGKSAPGGAGTAPPRRVWESIEATLRREGLAGDR
jgi:hypothetical protein